MTEPDALNALAGELALLKAEAEARRVIGAYMQLCDIPVPTQEMDNDRRCAEIADLFTQDAVWEGIGGAHGAQFGRQTGREAIRLHMLRFFTEQDPRLVFNTHYLCSERLQATATGVTGHWVQFQPWVRSDGSSLLRSSRLQVTFRHERHRLKMAHYRTESLFIADLPTGWAATLLSHSLLDTGLLREGAEP